MTAKQAIVTGGAGFIGSHVVDSLLADGYGVTVIDDLSSGSAENVAGEARLVELDVVDGPAVRSVVQEVAPEAVFHLAAQASVTASVENPLRDCDVNVKGTLNVLVAANELGTPGGVHVDRRGAVWGRGADAHERGARAGAAGTVRGVEVGGRGVRQDVVAGGGRAEHGGEARQRVRAAAEPARRGGSGGDLRAQALQRRAADAIRTRQADARLHIRGRRGERAARRGGQARHIQRGHGRADRRDTIWSELQKIAGVEIEPRLADLRQGELQHSCLDASRAERELGWHAQVSIQEGLRRTYEALVQQFARVQAGR